MSSFPLKKFFQNIMSYKFFSFISNVKLLELNIAFISFKNFFSLYNLCSNILHLQVVNSIRSNIINYYFGSL